MSALKRAIGGKRLAGLAVLMTACWTGGSTSPTTAASGSSPTTTAAPSAVATAGSTVTILAPHCPSAGAPASTGPIQSGGIHT
jgi:hypothetical protein